MKSTNKDIQDKLHLIKTLNEDIQEYKNINVSNAFEKAIHKIKVQSGKLIFWNVFNKIAAILVIPLLISTLTLLYKVNQNKDYPTEKLYTEVKASPGTIIQVELPDHSHVWLNSGSSLRYPLEFTDAKRKVELKGEAFFDVQANPDNPFEVIIPSGLQIVAHGTEFNVCAYDNEHFDEIVLQEGIVNVWHDNQQITMNQNEMVSFDKTNNYFKKNKINTDEKTAWKHGIIIFRNTPLEDVMKQLSRRYNVDITLHKTKNTDYRVRATFSTETITQILDFLKMAAPIEWELSEVEQKGDDTFVKQHIDIKMK